MSRHLRLDGFHLISAIIITGVVEDENVLYIVVGADQEICCKATKKVTVTVFKASTGAISEPLTGDWP